MIDSKKIEKIKQKRREREIEKVKVEKQMEIDILQDQLEKLQKQLSEREDVIKTKDKEINKLKKSKK